MPTPNPNPKFSATRQPTPTPYLTNFSHQPDSKLPPEDSIQKTKPSRDLDLENQITKNKDNGSSQKSTSNSDDSNAKKSTSPKSEQTRRKLARRGRWPMIILGISIIALTGFILFQLGVFGSPSISQSDADPSLTNSTDQSGVTTDNSTAFPDFPVSNPEVAPSGQTDRYNISFVIPDQGLSMTTAGPGAASGIRPSRQLTLSVPYTFTYKYYQPPTTQSSSYAFNEIFLTPQQPENANPGNLYIDPQLFIEDTLLGSGIPYQTMIRLRFPTYTNLFSGPHPNIIELQNSYVTVDPTATNNPTVIAQENFKEGGIRLKYSQPIADYINGEIVDMTIYNLVYVVPYQTSDGINSYVEISFNNYQADGVYAYLSNQEIEALVADFASQIATQLQ